MPKEPCRVSTLLYDFIDVSKDGYGIFDTDDKLVYANYVYRDIFCLPQDTQQSFTFEQMVRHAFELKRGINIEADNVDDWLKYVKGVRRKRAFRIFEVDLVDGRWMLFSEQELPSGELLVHTKDMTRQKVLESQLKHSVQTLNKLALTDELTQLANRRSFVQSVEQDIERCRKTGCAVTLLALDLDYFKKLTTHTVIALVIRCCNIQPDYLKGQSDNTILSEDWAARNSLFIWALQKSKPRLWWQKGSGISLNNHHWSPNREKFTLPFP